MKPDSNLVEGNKILNVSVPITCYVEARKKLVEKKIPFQRVIAHFLYEISIGSSEANEIIARTHETRVEQKISESRFKLDNMNDEDMNSLYSLLEKEQRKS
jgi:phage-related protein